MYDPATDQYDDLSSAYSGEDLAAGSVLYNDQVWLSSSNLNLTKFAVVSAEGMTRTDKASNPNGLASSSLIQLEEVMLTFGGSEQSEQAPGSTRINMYNFTSDEWTTLPTELPLPLNGAAAALVGQNIYLFGGVCYEDNVGKITDKYWVVPCVNPSVCDHGCDSQTGMCNLPPVTVAPVSSPVTEAPVNSPATAPTGSISSSEEFIGCQQERVTRLRHRVLCTLLNGIDANNNKCC
jgi:hypothetical protein